MRDIPRNIKNFAIMKLVIKKTFENVSSYNRKTDGHEFITTVNSIEEFKSKIESLEDQDYFDQEDGRVLDQDGNEVYDPSSPDSFDFGDYRYFIIEADSLDEDWDQAIVKSIEINNPWNKNEIFAQVNWYTK